MEVDLMPFYRLQRRTYAVYFDLFTPAEWEAKKAEYAAERERQRRLQEATVAFFQPGEMQPERDFNFQSEGAEFGENSRIQGRAFRYTRNWMSCDMPLAGGPMPAEPGRALALVVTYFQDEWRKRTFVILVDGEKIAEQVVEREECRTSLMSNMPSRSSCSRARKRSPSVSRPTANTGPRRCSACA